MPEFSYEALNQDNQPTSGCESAESVSAAIANLESQGLRVTSIHQIDLETADSEAATENHPTLEKATSDDQQELRQCVAEVYEKRDILIPALSAFAEELPRGRSRRVLCNFVSKLSSGTTVEELCKSEGPIATWLPLLSCQTSSKSLLSDFFIEATHESENRAQWVRALIYPLFVLFAALVVFVFLCIAVIPTFRSIFEDFDMNLPDITIGILSLSDLILHHSLKLVAAILVGGLTLYLLFRFLSVWGLTGRIWGGLTTGNSQQVTATARFTRRLAEALKAGMALPTALRLAGRAEGWSKTKQAALHLANDAEQENFNLKESPWARHLPATVVHAMQAGPDRKPNILLLQHLATLYTSRVRDRCDWSTGFMAQIAIAGMGLTVGVVVLALFLPLVQLINGLTG